MIPVPIPTPTISPVLLERPTSLPTPTPRERPTATATPTPTAKEVSAQARANRPTKGPEYNYVFTEHILEELISQHGEIHKYLINILGGYDRYVHVMYELDEDN